MIEPLIKAINPFWVGLSMGLVVCSLLFVWLWITSKKHYASIIAGLNHHLKTVDASNQTLKTQIAVADEKVSHLQTSQDNLAAATMKLEDTRAELALETAKRARAEQQCSRIEELESEITANKSQVDNLQQNIINLKTANAELQTRSEEERKNSNEKLQLVQNAEKQLIHQFESLAGKILEEKSKTFTKQNKINLDNVLNPLREQLTSFRKKVDDVYISDTKDRASLREVIKNLNLENQRISLEANNLVRALKGDKKTQGNWGELVLERVLEQSGLRKGIEYDTQEGFRDADNRLLKPDVVVHLPEGKDIIIDSKVSLVAFETYSSADNDEVQTIALTEHIQAIRNHIKGLSNKNYSDVKGLRSLDFVFMFMPIEAAFLAAFHKDDKLFSDAFQHNIIVVTPTTLLATLRTVENIWRYERQNENARIIADKAGIVYDKLRGFVDDLEKLGTQISTVQNTYDGVMNKLTTGKGNLIRQANNFVELGVKVKKPLSKSITEQSDLGTGEINDDNDTAKSKP